MDSSFERAATLMTRQCGLAHVSQLRRLGLTDARIDARLRSGSWSRAAAEVVAVSGSPASDASRIWRAVLAAGTREDGAERPVAVGSLAAAALLGLGVAVPDRVEVVYDRRLWCPRPQGVRVRQVSDWDARRFVRVGGLLVTALPDTLVDLAPFVADAEHLTLVQEACYDRVDLLGRVFARCHRGSKGSARARRTALALAGGIDSVLHARAVAALRRHGLGPWRCGVEVVPGAGPSDCVYVVDGIPVVALEFDGDVHRLSRKAFLHDRAKDLALRGVGCETVRFTVEQVSRPDDLAAHVRRALTSAQLAMSASTRGVA